MSARDAFRGAIAATGLTPPDSIEADGTLHRFSSNGRNGDDAGWYVFHDDGIPAGSFGDWRTGVSQTWRADLGRKLSPVEVAAHAERVAQMRHAREADDAQRQAHAKTEAAQLWASAEPARDDHPYLVRKGVRPHGIRQRDGRLLIPLRDDGELWNVEQIEADPGAKKRGLRGGRRQGCYHSIGKPNGVLCIAEGYATGASIYEHTGHAVAVAFNAGNLPAVAGKLRAKMPDTRIVVCADDDYQVPGNPGLAKATEAARAIGGLLAVPNFGTERPEGATDFNDLATHSGTEALKRAVASAKAPPAAERAGGPDSAPTRDPWPDPLPLPVGLQPVEPFAFELLPGTLQPWVRDICERVQCPPDFVGATVMAALGSLIARKVGIRPQEKTDWTVLPNQWALCIGRPGVLKSPAMEAALAPLKRLAKREAERHAVQAEAFALDEKIAKLRIEAAEKEARAQLNGNRAADVRNILAADPLEQPTLRRYIANDATAAALGELLRQNPNGTLVFRDELVSLLKALDREDNTEARGFYLTGWNGDSGYTFDRIGRGMNLHIPAVCISLLGSTQPGRVAEYVRVAVRGGSADDGLIQRFGLTVWPDTGGEWRDVDRWPDSEARQESHRVFEMLDAFDPLAIGAQPDEFDGVPFLRFDGDAHELFLEWRTRLEARVRAGELHPALEAHFAKYRKLVPGLALILHLADGGDGPVREGAALKALAWSEYLETHAQRLYASATSPEVPAAKAIIERLRKGDLAHKFSSRDVWRPGWAHLADRELVADALQLLTDLDWLVAERIETRGRTATVYHANPKGLQS